MSAMFGSHAPYTERAARGYRVFYPGAFTPGAESFKDLSWQARPSTFGLRITGANGAAIRPGRKGHLPVPYNCMIIGNRIMADRSGSIAFAIYRTSFAHLPALPGDTLTPLDVGRPALSGQQTRQDFALYGWQTRLLKGEVLAFEVLSASGIGSVTLSLIVQRFDQP